MRTWNQNGESVGCDPEQSGTAACASGLTCAGGECRACCREAALNLHREGIKEEFCLQKPKVVQQWNQDLPTKGKPSSDAANAGLRV